MPIGRAAQSLIEAPKPPPRRRSGRAWLWLLIGLFLVLGIAVGATYFMITSKLEAPELNPQKELQPEPGGVKAIPLETEDS